MTRHKPNEGDIWCVEQALQQLRDDPYRQYGVSKGIIVLRTEAPDVVVVGRCHGPRALDATCEELLPPLNPLSPEGLLRAVAAAAGAGAAAIVRERIRQRDVEGYDAFHDDQHDEGELAVAAACYATAGTPACVVDEDSGADAWPWGARHDKRLRHPRLRRIAVAGALLAAERDRIERTEP